MFLWFSVSNKDLHSQCCRICREKVPLGRGVEAGHLRPGLVTWLLGLVPATPLTYWFRPLGLLPLYCAASHLEVIITHISVPHKLYSFSSFPKLYSPTSLPPYVPLSHQKLHNHEGYVCHLWWSWDLPRDTSTVPASVFLGTFQSDRTFKEAFENQAKVQGEGTGTKHSCSFSPWAAKTETCCSCSSS